MANLPHNPYNNINAIENPDLFFNRKKLVEKLLSSLFAGSGQCFSLIGQRKSGKTSLIKYLSRPTTLQKFGYKGDRHLFVYVDCGQNRLRGREDFYGLLLNRLSTEAAKKLPDFAQNANGDSRSSFSWRENTWQEKWDSALEELADHAFYSIVILDRFEELIQKHQMEEELFGSLHAYPGPNFSWITCTFRPLDQLFDEAFKDFGMSESKQISASDFYNLFGSYYPVDLFSQEDIEELITFPSNRQGIAFSPEVQHAILRFGGRFPYFIQRACYYFFEAQLKGAINIEEVLQGSRRDAERLWLRYWDKLNMQQQRLLFSIASDFPVETSSTVEYLKDTALVYEEQGHLYPYSEEFGRFIRSREHSHMGFPVNQGDHLWGQYEVEDILGRTQHSQVVKARESYLEDYFAIKLPYVNQDLNEEQIAQILDLLTREAKILAHLEHKNIGKVHSVRLNPMGVIMPWIEGQPLDKVMEKRRPLKPVQVIEIGLQLADALRYAHAHGIIHRDIKPNNILLTSDDQLILIDFDVAHSEDQHTITSTNGTRVYVGNKNYGAPEQFDPVGQVEQAADLFALGMVLYELVTTSHQRPFTYGPNPKAYGGQLPPPERYAIPDPLYQILCPLLHQDPAQRLSADQLYEALQTCLKVLEGNDSHE